MRENGTFVSTYHDFTDELLQEIYETIGDEPAVFPFRFVFVPTETLDDIFAQLFVLRNIKRYKVWMRENFIILRKRKQKLTNTLHIAPDGEFVF